MRNKMQWKNCVSEEDGSVNAAAPQASVPKNKDTQWETVIFIIKSSPERKKEDNLPLLSREANPMFGTVSARFYACVFAKDRRDGISSWRKPEIRLSSASIIYNY